MKTSDTVAEFFKSFNQAQSKFKNPAKNRSGYGYKYADLTAVLEAVLPHLNAHAISLAQSVSEEDGKILLETRLIHTSGEWIASSFSLTVTPNKGNYMQGLGSAITYARRYSLQSLVGIVADEDDDGESSKQVAHKPVAIDPSIQLKTKVFQKVLHVTGLGKENVMQSTELSDILKQFSQETKVNYPGLDAICASPNVVNKFLEFLDFV